MFLDLKVVTRMLAIETFPYLLCEFLQRRLETKTYVADHLN